MSPDAWGIVALVVTALVGVLAAWLRKRLGLSDEAGQAVKQAAGKKPSGYDEALLLIAGRVQDLDAENEALKAAAASQRADFAAVAQWAIYVEMWGYRGWAHAPEERREDPPPKPDVLIVRLRED